MNRWKSPVVGFFVLLPILMVVGLVSQHVRAACASLPTDKGTVTSTVNVAATGNYYIWSRNKAPDSSSNGYYLQLDNSSSNCFTVGDTSIPTNTWTWVNYQNGNTGSRMVINNLSAGSHTFKMYGLDANLSIDRIILTTDSACTPSGSGDNCANSTTDPPPIVVSTNPSNNTPGYSGTITVGSGSGKTIVKVDGQAIASGTGAVSVDTTQLSDGYHTLAIESIDANGNKTVTYRKILVENHKTPWAKFYNGLYNGLGKNRWLTILVFSLILLGLLLVIGLGLYLAWYFKVWEKIPYLNRIHLKFLHVPAFIYAWGAHVPTISFPFMAKPAVHGGAGGAVVGGTHAAHAGTLEGNVFQRFFSHPGSRWFVVLGFALVGTITALYSLAATTAFVIEPERGSLSGVTTVSDSSASGSSAIRFGAGTTATCPAGQTGTPPNCVTPPPATCPAGQTGTPPNCVTPPASGGVSTCDPSKGYADELCWYNNTGVLNTTTSNPYDRWTEGQITSGAASAQLAHVGTQSAPVVVNLSTPGMVYENKWVDGCIKITANNVTVRNVLLRIAHSDSGSYQRWQCSWDNSATKGPAGLTNGGAQSGTVIQDVEIDGGFSLACATPPWGTCPVTYNFDAMMMNATGNMTFQRLNSHGGYAFLGYIGGSKIEDSYLHDVGHVHKFPQGDSRNDSPDDYHHDIIWAQGMSNWSITHSFGTQWHDSDPWTGSSGGCLCDNNGSNWVFNNVFMDGQNNVDIAASGTHSKVVAQNVYGAHTNLGSIFQNPPTNYGDYSAGAWTPSFSSASPAIPIIDRSRCSGIYSVTTAGVATKVGC